LGTPDAPVVVWVGGGGAAGTVTTIGAWLPPDPPLPLDPPLPPDLDEPDPDPAA
jgi:hypothetical protein